MKLALASQPFSTKAELYVWSMGHADSVTAQDCEFTYLSTQILHLLGVEGPATREPSKYIRYIYNRIILENATVRAAAVSSLAKFGANVESLKDKIVVLLKRALFDNDDEVCTIYQQNPFPPSHPFLPLTENFPYGTIDRACRWPVTMGQECILLLMNDCRWREES